MVTPSKPFPETPAPEGCMSTKQSSLEDPETSGAGEENWVGAVCGEEGRNLDGGNCALVIGF